MIEDKELRDLFKIESEEHLQHLDEGLLRLETNPTDQATLEEVFREVHSLKGSARMLGVSDVETIAHRFEDILGAAKREEIILTSETVDRLYRGLDIIRKLVEGAITGKPTGINVLDVLTRLETTDLSPRRNREDRPIIPIPSFPTTVPECSARREIESDPQERREESGSFLSRKETQEISTLAHSRGDVAASTSLTGRPELPVREEGRPGLEDLQTQTKGYQIETIRVEPRKLDILMTQVGELTVTKIRIARHLAEIEEIIALWEEWMTEATANRFILQESEDAGVNFPDGAIKRFIHFHGLQQERFERLGVLLNQLKTGISEDSARLDFVANELEEGIRVIRLLPLSTIFNLFPRMARDLAKDQSKEIQLIIEGGETTADKHILEEMKDPLMHMVRNAIDHGIETPEEREQKGKSPVGSIWLRAYRTATNIVIEVTDDGQGLDIEAIKRTAIKRGICREDELVVMTPAQIRLLIFSSGFSTRSLITDVSGRGVGLDVVRANVERLKGTILVESSPGLGCTFRVQLPITLATVRVLIVVVEGRNYALPVEYVHTIRMVWPREIFFIEGQETFILEGRSVSLARLSELLEIQTYKKPMDLNPPASTLNSQSLTPRPCIVLSIGEDQLGLFVDALLDEQEIMLKPHTGILKRVRNVSGATILKTGEVCIVLNPHDLIKSVQKKLVPGSLEGLIDKPEHSVGERKQLILLVEDSITTRTQEKRILESAGYEVITAVDGIDALNKLRIYSFDAVVSDIQMPNMDGLTLTTKIRQDKKYKEIPIILVTSLATDEDKKKGIEVGADAYITKPGFDQTLLLDTLKKLL